MVEVSEIQLEAFQDDARQALVRLTTKRLLDEKLDPTLLLKAPTGAGKTIISGTVMNDLADDQALDICFIWLAPLKLHQQSLESLRRVIGSSQKLSGKDDIVASKYIDRNEVVFLNWASLNKNEANLIKGSEERSTFKQICDTTRERGRKIVVVIDESQVGADTLISQEIKEMIGASVLFEMSATPNIKNIDGKYEVPRDEVVDAGLIKKSVHINAGVAEGGTYDGEQLDEALLDLAVKQRATLAAAYQAEGSDVNPLLLIQLPDASAGQESLDRIVERLDKEHAITYASGRLARWLSSDATHAPTDPGLIGNSGEVDVLLFKQAIATGWDCPRAHVLLKLRDPSKSETFEVQTIGRIMRMPERHHYENEDLNKAFVFHPHEVYKPAEDFTIVTREARWRGDFEMPALDAEWLVRGETPFIEPKQAKAIAVGLLKKLGVDATGKPSENKAKLASGGFDTEALPDRKLSEAIIAGEDDHEIERLGDAQVSLPAVVVERAFHRLVRRCVGVAANPGLLADQIYAAFSKAVGFDIPATQAFLVANAKDLDEEFIVAVDEVSPRSSRSTRLRRQTAWQPPNPRPYNTEVGTDIRQEAVDDLDGYAYEPCFLAVTRSGPEKLFESWLSEQAGDGVIWWMKNGEQGGTDLSLIYGFQGITHNFFPDYIVCLEDGRVGLFETKAANEAFVDSDTERDRNLAKMAALRGWVLADPGNRHAAFVVATPSNSLRWSVDEAPVGASGNRMASLL